MASGYPGSLDNFTTSRTNGTAMNPNQADDHNNYADAINKMEAELGTDPSGPDYASVKLRLADGLTSTPQAWTVSGGAGRTFDAAAATPEDTAQALAQLLADLQTRRMIV